LKPAAAPIERTFPVIVRRAIAFSLMVLFSLTLIAPLFAPDADANLPACCRRNGKHHCMMRMMERTAGNQEASPPSPRSALRPGKRLRGSFANVQA
jgi:hypothetical protein